MLFFGLLLLAAIVVLGTAGGIIMYVVSERADAARPRRYLANESAQASSRVAQQRPRPPPAPPSLSQLPSPVPRGHASTFASQAATFSLVAPFVGMGITIFLQPQVHGNRWAMGILSVIAILLIVLGLVFGIIALFATGRHGPKSILRKATVGTFICGLLTAWMLSSIPGLLRAVERAKEIQKQRMEERTP